MTVSGPLLVRPNGDLLLDSTDARAEEARHRIGQLADLVKTPNPYYLYRISRFSIWNALAAGWTGETIVGTLADLAGASPPPDVRGGIEKLAGRYGRFRIVRRDDALTLIADARHLAWAERRLADAGLTVRQAGGGLQVDPLDRGTVKLTLCRQGYPVEDLAGYDPAESVDVDLRRDAPTSVSPRDYQSEAIDSFLAGPGEGHGVVVLPCGAGKTLVGIGALAALKQATLILVPGGAVARQWIRALAAATTLHPDHVGEFSGERKAIGPVTVATYQTAARQLRAGHDVFAARAWGLIVYDEVHCLPAPVFRTTAGLQARRRLGLSATLVREDGREADVFSLIGPKRYDAGWPELTQAGWIAPVSCVEVRVPLPPTERAAYAAADGRGRARIAATNPAKAAVARRILADHPDSTALIIGQYLDQLAGLAEALDTTLVTGRTHPRDRDLVYADLRTGRTRRAVLSRVANQAIDLPAADLAIEVSGCFGSRQEEAQRLGRILRPKGGRGAHFYALVAAGTVEEEYAARRQRFLLERGYQFRVERWTGSGGRDEQ